MKRCIIKGENNYEVAHYQDYFDEPAECAISAEGKRRYDVYELINGVKVEFTDHVNFGGGETLICQFSYNNIVFKRIEREDYNLLSISNYMNKYNAFSKTELEKVVIQPQIKTKTLLQTEIEELQKQKVESENKIKIYKVVFDKVDQIKTELLKIENDLNE